MRDVYRVTGPRQVAGVKPGGTVHLEPTGVNIAALIAAGHITPAEPVAQGPEPVADTDVSQRRKRRPQ